MLFCQIDQGALKVIQQGQYYVDRVAQPQADIGCDLIVAAAPGVQAFAGVTDDRRKAFFDV